MGKESTIEWTNSTWNPWLGCTKVSPGCKNCYAERIMERMMRRRFDEVRRSKTTFEAPLKWKRPRMVFTCSMSDFFHKDADEWRDEAWEIIRRTPQHTYQILTKRPERIQDKLPETCFDCGEENWFDCPESSPEHRHWPWPNVWLGTSIESQTYDYRVAQIVEIPARVHFLSCEPLLGPIDLDFDPGCFWLRGVDWIITGGESGPAGVPRPAETAWFQTIRDQCLNEGIAFFHKQNGGSTKCKCHGAWGCRLLDGQTWDAMPVVEA